MKRIIEVSTPGTHVALRHGALTIGRNSQIVGQVPIEDLGVLILASNALSCSSALLSALAASGATVVVTGADHQPEGVLLPLRAHSTRGERIRAQTGASVPLQKRIWANLIRAKIRGQAALLRSGAGRRRLARLEASVRSGDADNAEAQAARTYWPLVFLDVDQMPVAEPFRRRRDGEWPNNLLNYGYAVLRAIVARAICGAGLLPEIGVHHHNRYDAFALASDLMEPFRPWVDHRCRELIPEGPGDLDRTSKEALLGIYDDPVLLGGEKTPLFAAVEHTATSLAAVFLASRDGERIEKATGRLLLPAFAALDES